MLQFQFESKSLQLYLMYLIVVIILGKCTVPFHPAMTSRRGQRMTTCRIKVGGTVQSVNIEGPLESDTK